MQSEKTNHPVRLVFLMASLLLLSSCTSYQYFKVDAISSGEPLGGTSFILVSGSPEIKEGELRFQHTASLVATALEGKGFHRAKDLGSADQLIEITYRVGEPRETVEVRRHPETYWRPGFSYTVTVPVLNRAGLVVGYRDRLYHEPSRSYTHWEDRIETSTVFEKELKVSSFDNRRGASIQNPKQLWSLTISNTNASDDLRYYLPYMLAAALPYVGEDTGSQIAVRLDPEDPKVDFIRNPELLAQ
jgi:hypothetical protein